MENAGDEISSLRKMIAEYERLYRIENAPAISDAEYDRLLRRLPNFTARILPLKRLATTLQTGLKSAPTFQKCSAWTMRSALRI